MIRSLSIIAAGVFAIGFASTVKSATARPATAATTPKKVEFGPDGLPVGPTHDTYLRVCSGCHVSTIVTKQRLDREGWDDVVTTMIDRGAQATPQEARQIAAYLAAGFPEH